MRPTRFSSVRAAVATAAAGLLAAGLLLAPSGAQAAPDNPDLTADQQLAAAEEAAALADRLGADRSAGTYYDETTGQMVVTVTDPAAAQTVRAEGGVAELVTYSRADLQQVTAELEAARTITGTAWHLDPATNQVVVSVDETVDEAELAHVRSTTAQFSRAVRIEQVPGTFEMTVQAGDAIFGDGGVRCSAGLNVESSSGQDYLITAGHCTDISSTWYASPPPDDEIGPVVVSSFPGDDYGIVRYDTNIPRPGTVNLYNGGSRNIVDGDDPFVGQSVLRSGSTTGVHGGEVTALNATVNYPQGTVFGLIRTTVCAEPGDSGGLLFSGNTAHGITSGGSGNCFFGGTTFYQPVTEVLDDFNLSVL